MSYPPTNKVTLASFANVFIEIPNHWKDITDTLPEGAPPTLAAENGVGALQLSGGDYRGGVLPDINQRSLKRLLYYFEDAQGFERQMKVEDWKTTFVFGITSDYQLADGFVRVWYCSDGKNVALLTFYTDPITTPALNAELEEVDAIARSLKFKGLDASLKNNNP